MSKELYTIAEIAAELGLSESTVRYYRDKFPGYIPAIGEGKKRRYKAGAIEALRFISSSLRSGRTAEETQRELNLKFQREIKIAAIAAAEPQQVDFPVKMAEMIAVQAESLKQIATLLQNRDKQEREMEEFKTTISSQQSRIEKLEAELEELKTRRSWWRRLFSK